MEYRTALITGGSSGIGLGLARRMAMNGVEVVLAARRGDILATEVDRIQAGGGSARALELDLTNVAPSIAAIQRVDDELGGLDLFVACAGVAVTRWSGKLRWQEDCEATLAVNVVGFTATVTSVLPRMVERKRGHIVGISSLAGYRGLPRMATYCGSKAYVSTFLEGLRVDLRSSGVKITDVRPGYVRTPMADAIGTADALPWLLEIEPAVEAIWEGIRRGRPVIELPWQLALAIRTAHLLPIQLYDPIIKRVL